MQGSGAHVSWLIPVSVDPVPVLFLRSELSLATAFGNMFSRVVSASGFTVPSMDPSDGGTFGSYASIGDAELSATLGAAGAHYWDLLQRHLYSLYWEMTF